MKAGSYLTSNLLRPLPACDYNYLLLSPLSKSVSPPAIILYKAYTRVPIEFLNYMGSMSSGLASNIDRSSNGASDWSLHRKLYPKCSM